jgi:hypothetical protein
LKILKTKIDWMEGYANDPSIYVLLKNIPNLDELRYRERNNCYFAEKDGYVNFFHYVKPDRGFGGREFPIIMEDGTKKILKGPWSSRAGCMNRMGFAPCIDVFYTDNSKAWERGYTFFLGALTVKLFDNIKIEFPRRFEARYSNETSMIFPVDSRCVLEQTTIRDDIMYLPTIKLPYGAAWRKDGGII